MALTFTKVSATPHALTYTITAAGAETADQTLAAIIADAATGPLKTALSAISAADQAALRTALTENIAFQFHFKPRTAVAFGIDAKDGVTLTGAASAAGSATLQIALRHTLVR